ncbi:30S ribosomal protein S4 [candidate division WOR-3 bacterium]|nr:30S ribosomal protein S4 [candidate division WOR-3 bacterium]
MARHTGSKCKLCRREGVKLFLKGDRCLTDKCAIEKGRKNPGETPKKFRRKMSGYAIQLREKQKTKRIYGIFESQFRKYYERSCRQKGVTGEVLLQYLERRLDNVLFRMNFAPSRSAARQIVNHGHITVNGRKVDIASFLVQENDEIEIKEKSKKMNIITQSLQRGKGKTPEWLEIDMPKMKAKVKQLPAREDIDYDINEQLIVELYSK